MKQEYVRDVSVVCHTDVKSRRNRPGHIQPPRTPRQWGSEQGLSGGSEKESSRGSKGRSESEEAKGDEEIGRRSRDSKGSPLRRIGGARLWSSREFV